MRRDEAKAGPQAAVPIDGTRDSFDAAAFMSCPHKWNL
jgi:hypothetical protein